MRPVVEKVERRGRGRVGKKRGEGERRVGEGVKNRRETNMRTLWISSWYRGLVIEYDGYGKIEYRGEERILITRIKYSF